MMRRSGSTATTMTAPRLVSTARLCKILDIKQPETIFVNVSKGTLPPPAAYIGKSPRFDLDAVLRKIGYDDPESIPIEISEEDQMLAKLRGESG